MASVVLHFADGHIEEHAAPVNGPHFMVGARHGKPAPAITWFVLERRENGRAVYTECCVEDVTS